MIGRVVGGTSNGLHFQIMNWNNMNYKRPVNENPLTAEEREQLLRDFLSHYLEIAEDAKLNDNFEKLNRKLPRDAAANLLDKIGTLLLEEAALLSEKEGSLKSFLDDNPMPNILDQHLPRKYRAFCLLLNSLKQWLSAEQAATDRYLLGGVARQRIRDAAKVCIVTGKQLSESAIELHHPVRDGRPPVPLSHAGHNLIETRAQIPRDEIGTILNTIRRDGNRSWVMLRRGLLLLSGQDAEGGTVNSRASAKSFARRSMRATNKSELELLAWLDENNLADVY